MSAAVGTFSSSKEIKFNNGREIEELKNKINEIEIICEKEDDDGGDDEEEEEEEEKEESVKELDLGPQLSLKEQLEKDKDDDSLRRWKEQLLGSVDISAVGESKEPQVKIVSVSMLSPGRAEVPLPIPISTNNNNNNNNKNNNNSKRRSLFTLKEGTKYHLKLSFIVANNIVSGLSYTNTVWKTGVRVDNTKVMLGTFSPKQEPYIYEFEEETTPSGIFARGSYSARTKIVDDDGKCYLDMSYHFEIQKKWPSR